MIRDAEVGLGKEVRVEELDGWDTPIEEIQEAMLIIVFEAVDLKFQVEEDLVKAIDKDQQESW